MDNIIVRETRLPEPDNLHKYNIYIPYQKGYINVYTCMHCDAVSAIYTEHIDEPDTNVNMKNIPLATLRHWCKCLVNRNRKFSNIAYAYLQQYLDDKSPNKNKSN